MAALDGNYHGSDVANHAVTIHGGLPA